MTTDALTISLIIFFIHATTWDKMIFAGIKRIPMPEWLQKPIYGCPISMTPWWGTLIYMIFFADWSSRWYPTTSFYDCFLTIGPACGISVIFVILLYIKEFCSGNTP